MAQDFEELWPRRALLQEEPAWFRLVEEWREQPLTASSQRAPRVLFQPPPVLPESSSAPAWFRRVEECPGPPRREQVLPESPLPADLTIPSQRASGLVRGLRVPLPESRAYLSLVPAWPVRSLPAQFAVRPQPGLQPPESRPPEGWLRER